MSLLVDVIRTAAGNPAGNPVTTKKQMLGKILFTLAVIVIVMVFFRWRARAVAAATAAAAAEMPGGERSLPVRALAYALLGALAGVCIVLFALDYRADNRIVHVRVISDGAAADYRARHKAIRGRNFTTIGGARVTLGAGERIEIRQ
ncbi:MAG: hypothetical protein OD918_11135 [Gammaproteobacteria bacterium]